MGERIVGEVEFLKGTKPFIRHHHERFDGLGYPDGLSGESVPLGARIIFIAEVFDALRSERSYYQSRDLKGSLGEMERGAGTQFDPNILRTFIENVARNSLNGLVSAEEPISAKAAHGTHAAGGVSI
jgi:HD-GYP domain-containing protein (c-di-GMP phosphodiesterase class II)